MLLIDDHLVRDLAAGELPGAVQAIDGELATTNLWLFRLIGALARAGLSGSLSSPLRELGDDAVARFRADLLDQLDVLTVVPMQQILWPMAELQDRHGSAGRRLSTAMTEVLAAAHHLGAGIAVAEGDVGPGLLAAAEADGVPFHVVAR